MDLRLHEYLTRISRLLQAEERSSAAGLLPVQLHALEYVGRCNRYSDRPAAVAEYLQVTKGTASQTLRILEDRGLIEKRTDEEDGRVVHLAITPRGRRLLGRVIPPPAAAAVLGDLPETEKRQLEDSLEGLLRGLQRANGGRTFGVCHTCRHFLREGAPRGERFRCGLTSERLTPADSRRICREHEAA